MKKHSTWTKVLALLTAVLMMSTFTAFAEGEAPVEEPVKQEAPKAEEPKPEAPKAEAPKAEEPKAEAPAEAPKAEEPKAEAPAEAPKAEEPKAEEPQAEAPAEEPAQEAAEEVPADGIEVELGEEPEEAEIVEIEDSEAPKGLFAEEDSAPVAFAGSVKVERKGNGEIFFGDRVTLVARVSDANTSYEIRWEVNRQDGAGWRTISGEHDAEYNFTVTPDNLNYEYRVVLVTAA